MVKKAHLVTGKGGVGKSLFSAVLAHYFSTQNKSILLTELNEHSFYRDYLNLPEISYKPLNWHPHLDIALWSPDDCLKEYALHLLKIESLYRLFIENPVTKSLIQIAPGLQELAILGKLTSSPRQVGPPMTYDEVVVDSYATGHFLSLLRAPGALNEAVPFGPMGEQSKGIDHLIRNPDFTHIHIVSLAEELPVTETIELYNQLKSEFKIEARVYLNKISGLTEAETEGLSEEARESLNSVIASENTARTEFKKAGLVFTELPLITSLNPEEIVAALAQQLRGSL